MKRKIITVGLSLLLLFSILLPIVQIVKSEIPLNDDWRDTNWDYRKQITIDSTLIDEDLIDFPFLINTLDDDLKDKALASGFDIVFTDTENNMLDFEMERFDQQNGKIVAWIRLPKLASTKDTEIFMYYGNNLAPDQSNPINVWNNNYLMVHHLNDISDNQVYDSTSNNNDGTIQGDVFSTNFAKIGAGNNFDGDGDYIDFGSNALGSDKDQFTISAWFKNSASGDEGDVIYSETNLVTGDLVELGMEGGKCIAVVYDADHGNMVFIESSSTLNDDQWHYVTFVKKASNDWEFFVDDESVHTDSTEMNSISINTVRIGNLNSISQYEDFSGIIDEVRVSNIARSTKWIHTNYIMMNDPNSFCSFSEETEKPIIKKEDQLEINSQIQVTEGETFDVTILVEENPIEDAEVTFNGETYLTDTQGVVSFIAPQYKSDENNEYEITATKMGYISATEFVITVDKIPVVELPKLKLNINPTEILQGDTFTITITDRDAGNTIGSVDVTFNGQIIQTDSNGEYTFSTESVNPDIYKITASKTGYRGADIKWIIIKPGDVTQQEVGWIWGQVYDVSGESIKGAKICTKPQDSTNSECVFSDENGVFISEELSIGTYLVKASKLGYETSEETSVVVEDGVATYVEFTLIETVDGQSEHDQLISDAIEAGSVGAKFIVEQDMQNSEKYSDVFDVEIKKQTTDTFSVTVNADDGTPGSFFIFTISKEVFSSSEFKVLLDGEEIQKIPIEDFPDTESETAGYVVFSEDEETDYVEFGVYVPHFSEHTITISQIIEILTGPVALAIYSVVSAAVLIFFVVSMVNAPYRPSYFKRKRRK